MQLFQGSVLKDMKNFTCSNKIYKILFKSCPYDTSGYVSEYIWSLR